jgi:drug/metabolite transporter (DMT)-like permease
LTAADDSAPAHLSPPLLAYASLAASMALVGAYVGLSKILLAVFPVFLLAWLRFGIGAVAMVHWVRRPADEPPLGPRHRALLFLESFLGNFLFSICMLYGIRQTTALAAGVIMAAMPAAVALLSYVFLKERPARRVIGGIACAVAGIALVSAAKHGDGAGGGESAWAGNLLLVGAVICEASYIVIGKSLSARMTPRRIGALVNLWGLALVTPFGVAQALSFDFGAVSMSIWTLLVFYALAASVWTVWLWMTGLQHVPASKAGVFSVMLPIAAAAVGVLVLGERFSGLQAAAFALALLGVLLASWPVPSRVEGPGRGASANRGR